jgi:uncharacterized protein (DUF1015 family)
VIQGGMAEIAAFRGIVYDTRRVDGSRVLAPPYDVIDDTQRVSLAAKDPYNCVRLILPEGDGDRKYESAKQTLAAWQRQGVLARDARPAIYRYHQIFTSPELGSNPVTRRGFIAAVRLHPFDERVILPHERTLAGPKIDRLKLWDACQTHLSQIFTLYSDPAQETDRAFLRAERERPVIDGTTDDGTRHIMWRVEDREVIGQVARVIAPLKLYIADGHHRYETMLALRDRIRERAGGDLPSRSTANFGALFLANMDDRGLIVLPTHRLVHDVAGFDRDAVIKGISEWFEVVPGPAAREAGPVRSALTTAGHKRPALGMVFPGEDRVSLIQLRDGVKTPVAGAPAVQQLDVSLLHQLILERVLGIDRAAQEAKTNLDYIKDTQQALDRARDGEGQVLFLMNPTPVSQVRDVADSGEVMPQKSTFFHPKIASGVVLNPIAASELLD